MITADLSNLAVAGAVAALAALGIGLFERRRSGTFPRLDSDPAPLSSAAELAYAYARERRLPLAAVAERKGGALWFARSIPKTVPVFATNRSTGRRTRLAVGLFASTVGSGEDDYSDPVIGAREFRAYLRWMTSVW